MNEEYSSNDIVNSLSKRLMNDVAEEIFSYLDYESLKNSELVSTEWKNSILYGKTWKKLLERNLKLNHDWQDMLEILTMKSPLDIPVSKTIKDYSYHRYMCQKVGNSVLKLQKNWSQGRYSTYQISCFSQPEIESIFWIRGSLNFEMNKKWIGRGQRDGSIILWNRWTWERKALFEPLLLTNRLLGCNTVRCLQFNDDFVVASYFGGSICVWDINTTELLQVLDEMDIANYESHYIPINGLSLGGSHGNYWLLSCLSSPTDTDIVTLRSIQNPSDEITIAHRIVLNHHLRVFRLMVNERHALLLLSDKETKQDRIQIRSTFSMDILRVITIPYSETGVFDYRNGVILTGSRYEIQLWDLETATCLRNVKSNTASTIVFVKIVSDKYWVSYNAAGQVQVWDMKTSLDPNQPDLKMLYQLNVSSIARPLFCPIIRIDEYQIAFIPCRTHDYSELHIVDFLQLDPPADDAEFSH